MANEIIIIPAEGKAHTVTLRDGKINRKTISAFVGGFAEILPAIYEGTEIICDSYGKVDGLPVNEKAANMLKDCSGITVYGKAVWATVNGIDYGGFTEDRAAQILETLNKEDD